MKLAIGSNILFYFLFCSLIHISYNFIKCEDFSEKKIINANQILEDSFRLSEMIFKSGFMPNVLIVLWRGGASVGVPISEYFVYKNNPIEKHILIRSSAYNHDVLKATVKMFNIDCLVKVLKKDDKVLIVDDVVDSGSTMKKMLNEINEKCGENVPEEIKVATLYYKPKTACIKPDYYLHEIDDWLVFPHELEGLSLEEIEQFKGVKIAETLK